MFVHYLSTKSTNKQHHADNHLRGLFLSCIAFYLIVKLVCVSAFWHLVWPCIYGINITCKIQAQNLIVRNDAVDKLQIVQKASSYPYMWVSQVQFHMTLTPLFSCKPIVHVVRNLEMVILIKQLIYTYLFAYNLEARPAKVAKQLQFKVRHFWPYHCTLYSIFISIISRISW